MNSSTDLETRFRDAIARGAPLLSVKSGAHVERSFADEVAEGLAATPRWLPTRFLYDAEGSRLFEAITNLPEYYPTRTEAAILAEHADSIVQRVGRVTLVELGSGYSVKTAHLLRAFGDVRYVPIDVSADALMAARASIARDYPAVEFMGVEGTFEEALPLLASLQPKLIFFLGSTIGNLTENECEPFWSQVTGSMAEGDHFLLGVDLVKDPSVLAAAYNDAAGVTARFTKNLFVRMNRELDTSIDLDAVQHEARWSPERERIETHAAFLERQTIELDGRRFEIEAGERVLVEISRKFRIETLSRELERFGLHRIDTFTDERDWFALLLLRRGAPGPG